MLIIHDKGEYNAPLLSFVCFLHSPEIILVPSEKLQKQCYVGASSLDASEERRCPTKMTNEQPCGYLCTFTKEAQKKLRARR